MHFFKPYGNSRSSRIRKKKIFHKYLTLVLPLIILSIVITSIVLSYTSLTYFRKTINQDYRNIIISSAGEIRLFMESAQKELESLSRVLSATKLDKWQKQMALTAFIHSRPRITAISLVSGNGAIVATTNLDVKEADPIPEAIYKGAFSGKTMVSGVMRQKGGIPYIHFGIPVFHLGEVVEVLWGVLNLTSIWDVLEGVTIGETGQVYIMDLSGRYLGHKEIERVVTTLPAGKPGILEEIHHSDEPIKWIEEKDGEEFYCLGVHIPALDWIIVLEQSLSEIYVHIYWNFLFAGLLTCFICIVAIVLGLGRVKKLLVPIHRLHQQVEIIGKGDLEQKVSIDARDEIGDLAMAFNEMTDSLKDHIEREVKTAKELSHARSLAVLGEASSKVTHEVGNLLNNVDMFLMVLRNENLGDRVENILGILERESGRVNSFIRNFLQFSKKPELNLTKVSMDLLFKQSMEVLQPLAKKKGARLVLDCPENLPPVEVDGDLMHQVINNLVKNGMEAVDEGGDVKINAEKHAKQLRISIQDTGPGIEPDAREHIFEPFFSTKGKKGTGLGLSIVKSIMEAHRGSIECESEPQKGARFILNMPLG